MSLWHVGYKTLADDCLKVVQSSDNHSKFSAGFVPTHGMLQSGGYVVGAQHPPPPQPPGHQLTLEPHQLLQQGNS